MIMEFGPHISPAEPVQIYSYCGVGRNKIIIPNDRVVPPIANTTR